MADQICLSKSELQDIIKDAYQEGGEMMLNKLGLEDENAGRDVQELRSLLSAFRSAKSTIWRTLWGSVTRFLFMVVLAVLFIKSGWLPLQK